MSTRYTTDYRQDMRLLRTTPQRVIAVVLAVFALALPFLLELDFRPPFGFPWNAWGSTINLALIAAIGAVAFNLLLGYTHQISVAHAAFLMLGTMLAAYLGTILGVPFLAVLLVSAVAGAVVGALVGLPALRFRGLYLLIATFGVHFFFLLGYRTFQTTFFGFSAIRFRPPEIPAWLHWLPFVTPDEDGEFLISGNFRWYWVILPITVASILFMVNVVRTREGRAFRAIAQHDVAASLIGINVTRSKLLAFAVSSAFVSLSGALSAYYVGARGEDSFPFSVVLTFAIMVIVGGFSSTQGAVFGTFFFYLAPVLFEWARAEVPVIRSVGFLQRYANETDLAVFGILIVVVLVARPEGLAGIWQGSRRYFARWPFST
jgi:branched-chain amino acid transport system permease protein